MAGCWLEEEAEVTGGDPSSSASHIKKSSVEQVGWAGGQPQPMRRGGREEERSITPKSSAYVAAKWKTPSRVGKPRERADDAEETDSRLHFGYFCAL